MTKELLRIEFRYSDATKNLTDRMCQSKKVTIGVFDTLEEAVKVGNDVLGAMSNYFEVRATDIFRVRGLFGNPDRFVSNCCYPTKGISYFATIEKLEFSDLSNQINECFAATERFIKYMKNQED